MEVNAALLLDKITQRLEENREGIVSFAYRLDGQEDQGDTPLMEELYESDLITEFVSSIEKLRKHATRIISQEDEGYKNPVQNPTQTSGSGYHSLPTELKLLIVEMAHESDLKEISAEEEIVNDPPPNDDWEDTDEELYPESDEDMDAISKPKNAKRRQDGSSSPVVFRKSVSNLCLVNRELYHLAIRFVWQEVDLEHVNLGQLQFFITQILPQHYQYIKSIMFPKSMFLSYTPTRVSSELQSCLISLILCGLPNLTMLDTILVDQSRKPDFPAESAEPLLQDYFIPSAICIRGNSLIDLRLVGEYGLCSIDAEFLADVLGHCPSLQRLELEMLPTLFETEDENLPTLGQTIASLENLKILHWFDIPLLIFKDVKWKTRLYEIDFRNGDVAVEQLKITLADLVAFLKPHAETLVSLSLHYVPDSQWFTDTDWTQLGSPFPFKLAALRDLGLSTYLDNRFLKLFNECKLETLRIGMTDAIDQFDLWEEFLKGQTGLKRLLLEESGAFNLGQIEAFELYCYNSKIECRVSAPPADFIGSDALEEFYDEMDDIEVDETDDDFYEDFDDFEDF